MKYNLYLKNLPAVKSKVYWYYKPGIKKSGCIVTETVLKGKGGGWASLKILQT